MPVRSSTRSPHQRSPLTVAEPSGDESIDIPRRLVVELGRQAASDLSWLVSSEEMNKTTIVNRAIQLYKVVMEAQVGGGGLILEHPDRGAERLRLM